MLETGAEMPSFGEDSHPKLIVTKSEEYKQEDMDIVSGVGKIVKKSGIREEDSIISPYTHDLEMPHVIGERFDSDENNSWAGPVFVSIDPSELYPLDQSEIIVNYQREGLLRYQGKAYSGASGLDSSLNSITSSSYRQTPSLSSISTGSSTWQRFDISGNRQFKNRNYAQALADFRAALGFNCPSLDKQILLSNVVACRLKIGGMVMAESAIEEAKKCIAINNRWPKGYIRLASAYIALGGHYDNAFNALQRALAIDPSNQVACKMLHNLRRDGGEDTSSTPPIEEKPEFEEFHPHPLVKLSSSNTDMASKQSDDGTIVNSTSREIQVAQRSSPFISFIAFKKSYSFKRRSQRFHWMHQLRCPSRNTMSYERL